MEQQYWQSRYEQAQTGWNIGDVSTPIKAYLDQLTDKNIKILIPGCGFGYEAIYAHKLGFKNVFVVDFVKEALEQLKIKCPTFPLEHILHADFFEIEGQYDLVIEQTLFCAINPNQRENYAKQINRILKKGGKLVGLLFNREFESGPPFGGNVEEYQNTFSPYFEKIEISPCHNSIPARAGSEVFIKFMH
jgi:thiopurine S-methyltransferase